MEKEREVYLSQASNSNKPKEIVEKMVEGRLKKFLDEVSLVGQPFVKDTSLSIRQLLSKNKAEVTSFVRFELGEGIEKKKVDFAKEVESMVQK